MERTSGSPISEAALFPNSQDDPVGPDQMHGSRVILPASYCPFASGISCTDLGRVAPAHVARHPAKSLGYAIGPLGERPSFAAYVTFTEARGRVHQTGGGTRDNFECSVAIRVLREQELDVPIERSHQSSIVTFAKRCVSMCYSLSIRSVSSLGTSSSMFSNQGPTIGPKP